MPFGGQCAAGSSVRANWIGSFGKSEASKKAQNQATKNITSEAMKRIMP